MNMIMESAPGKIMTWIPNTATLSIFRVLTLQLLPVIPPTRSNALCLVLGSADSGKTQAMRGRNGVYSTVIRGLFSAVS
jgi:hypothetical protein